MRHCMIRQRSRLSWRSGSCRSIWTPRACASSISTRPSSPCLASSAVRQPWFLMPPPCSCGTLAGSSQVAHSRQTCLPIDGTCCRFLLEEEASVTTCITAVMRSVLPTEEDCAEFVSAATASGALAPSKVGGGNLRDELYASTSERRTSSSALLDGSVQAAHPRLGAMARALQA